MKNIVILGSTGSIGTQTLEVIDAFENYNVLALTANTSIDLLEQQARKFVPEYVVIKDNNLVSELEKKLKDTEINVLTGMEGLEYVSGLNQTDLVVNSLVGAIGLKPSVKALKAGNDLALANKESMVIGGNILNKILKENKVRVLPLDSEHNAIFQIIEGHKNKEIKKIFLTASGGPFLDLSKKEMENVTVSQALAHPNWDMGAKITIDSATLMNKGLEVIEAHYLFDQPYDKIEVVIHPESIIHSMVKYIDNAIYAELGASDMKNPIQNILTYPQTKKAVGEDIDLIDIGQLNFLAPDMDKFPALRLAYQAGKTGGSMPVVLNAANEIAVGAFLNKKINYNQISDIIEKVINRHNKVKDPGLEEVLEIDRWARLNSEEVIDSAVNNS